MAEEGKPTQSAQLNQPADAAVQGTPNSVWIGMTIKWDSPLVEAKLIVELPFWLFVPDSEMTVAIEDSSLRLSITGESIEIQEGRMYLSSRSNVLHIERKTEAPSEKGRQVIEASKNGFVLRTPRTLVTMHTQLLEDCVTALDEKGQRADDAAAYMQSLAIAHLPFVNKLINAYRRTAPDPFAMEVTEWDVPVWFLLIGDRIRRISLARYADIDGLPTRVSSSGQTEPLYFADATKLSDSLGAGDTPGDVVLLDAWSLYYRGRFGDAIRSLVTAIEVVLEAKLREALTDKGMSERGIDERLQRTFNDFDKRLLDYSQVTGRKIPGPLISMVPYVNGIRLRQELDDARQLRHKVVHEDLRLERSLRGKLHRAMETVSWLFDWFRKGAPMLTTVGRGYVLRQALAACPDLFSHSYTNQGVLIKPLAPETIVEFPGNPILHQLPEALDENSPDMDKFGISCLILLGFRRVDGPMPEPESPLTWERCCIVHGAELVPVFLIETPDLMKEADLAGVATRALALKMQGRHFSSVLCILNHQSMLAWPLRETEKAVPETVCKMAAACGIAVVTTVDLLLLIQAATSNGWDLSHLRTALLSPGRQGGCPSNCRSIGVVKHFYAKSQAMSIALEPAATIRAGDTLVIRLRDRYHLQPIESMEVDRCAVSEVKGEVSVGIKTSLQRSDVPLGAPVFVLITGPENANCDARGRGRRLNSNPAGQYPYGGPCDMSLAAVLARRRYFMLRWR